MTPAEEDELIEEASELLGKAAAAALQDAYNRAIDQFIDDANNGDPECY